MNVSKPLAKGDQLPLFSLNDHAGIRFSLESVLGNKPLVVYFYPKNETPGCTAEACSFRDHYQEFSDAGAEVIGISSDGVDSHARFRARHALNFRLLSDEGDEVRRKYGIRPDFFGLLPARVTFVADKNGTIVNIYRSQFSVNKHIATALQSLRDLS